MMNYDYISPALRKLLLFAFSFLLLVSCGPVHRFTRVKKIPREFTFNYCGEEIRAPRSDLNKMPWVVYSDRDPNFSYVSPGGKVKAKEAGYLDPFLVIGRKGDFLELVKYAPDLLKNGKLEYKKAEYWGWMHKSRLLLTEQSVTDIASGRKIRMMALFSDLSFLDNPKKFFVEDSIRLYRNPSLTTPVGAMPLSGVIYRFKNSEDGSSVLVGRKPLLETGKADEGILGWVDTALVKEIGVGLHLSSRRPVTAYSERDSFVMLRSGIVMPMFDYGDNFILNVDGETITHKEYRKIADDLRRVNVSFVVERGTHTLLLFPRIVNALQSLQPMMEEVGNGLDLRFNAVVGLWNHNESHLVEVGFTDDYGMLLNSLTDMSQRKDFSVAWSPCGNYISGEALRRALDLLDDCREATNVIVLVGDTGFVENSKKDLSSRLLRNNCRLLGFQSYGGEGDTYNDFVLDVEALIDSCATGMLKRKRKLLVSPSQMRRENRFLSVGDSYNGYRLDFPQHSITQGALFFPQKAETLPMEVLANNVDSILRQVSEDNRTITLHLENAFRSMGNNRTKFDSLFIRHFELPNTLIPSKELMSCFPNASPVWLLPSTERRIELSDNDKVDYCMLLTEPEMNELKEFVASLSEKEVDYITQLDQEKKNKHKQCDCPEDDWFELDKDSMPLSPTGKYANTSDVRRHITHTYLRSLKYCRLCKESNGHLAEMTLAKAHFRITGYPVSDKLLDSIKIKDLKDKNLIPDNLLDRLVTYFKVMREELDSADRFELNGQVYYWLK